MDETHRASAERIRALLSQGDVEPAVFRAALMSVPADERDAWLDSILGIDELPADGPDLPRGCVPYVPCSVEALLLVVERAQIRASDVFVDLGAGLGRAAAFVHLLTGAAAIGIEVQRELVRASCALTARLNLSRVSPVEGDAALLAGPIVIGSVFFLYCPFSGARLERVLDGLEPIARTRRLRVCSVDLPLPPRPWLELASPAADAVLVYWSAPPPAPAARA